MKSDSALGTIPSGDRGSQPTGDPASAQAERQPTQVRVIDLCGRREPFTVDLCDARDILELSSDDIDHILDMWADGNTAFIGEFEYQEVARVR